MRDTHTATEPLKLELDNNRRHQRSPSTGLERARAAAKAQSRQQVRPPGVTLPASKHCALVLSHVQLIVTPMDSEARLFSSVHGDLLGKSF